MDPRKELKEAAVCHAPFQFFAESVFYIRRPEFRMFFQKPVYILLILARIDRTGTVDQRTAWLHICPDAAQDLSLQADQALDPFR